MRRSTRLLVAILWSCIACPVVHAQRVIEGHEVLAADRPEAWAMNHAAAATLTGMRLVWRLRS